MAENKIGFLGKIGKFFRDSKSEMKKITWESKDDLIKSTIVVVVVIVISTFAVLVLNKVFSNGLSAIYDLFND